MGQVWVLADDDDDDDVKGEQANDEAVLEGVKT
jgi:hypothetical protein